LKALRKILDFLGSRNGIRLVSVLAAIATWYAIRAATSNSIVITDIPLAVQPPPGWTIVERSAKAVDVAFLGTRDDLRYLNRELIKATVDVRDRTTNQTFVVELGPADINAPGTARVEFIRPSAVSIRLDREITKEVRVAFDIQNQLPDGYELEAVTVNPESVEISGPARHLARIDSIRTLPIDLDGRIRSINKRRIALVPDSRTPGVTLDPPYVTLDLTIAERFLTAPFSDVPILPLLPPGRRLRADLDPAAAAVTVKGRPKLINNLQADDIRLFVDAASVEETGPVDLSVRAVLPGGVSVAGIDPPRISVVIRD